MTPASTAPLRRGTSRRHIGRWLLSLPSRYRVSVCVWLAPAVATIIARWVLGDDPTAAQVERLGYGIPALEDGRVWTLVTGAVVVESLSVTLWPSFSLVGVVLLERRAGHWRSAVAFAGGQLLGVLLALLVTWPLRGSDSAFAREVTGTVDFGFSVGGFAALGVWTCYLTARWRRPLRVAIGLYLVGQLLLSGLIYDVSHPIGFLLGTTAGARWLLPPDRLDPAPLRAPRDVVGIGLGVVVGIAAGVVVGWNAGGVGGAFGWGPG